MRFINLFLAGYVVLMVGIGIALWQSGILARLSAVWVVVGVLVAVGVGIMLAVSSGKPAVTEVQR